MKWSLLVGPGLILILILIGCSHNCKKFISCSDSCCKTPSGGYDNISAGEVKQLMDSGGLKEAIFLDVRTPDEYAAGHIPGSVNLPLNSVEEKAGKLEREKPIIVYCQSGDSQCSRSLKACKILKKQRFNRVKNMVGGITEWQRVGGEIEGSGQEKETGQTKMPVWELGHGCED